MKLTTTKANLAIILTDADHYIIWVNEGFTNITGYTLAEVHGRKPSLLQGKDTSLKVVQQFRSLLREGISFTHQILNYKKDGTKYPCRLVIHPIYNAEKVITNFIAFEIDADRSNFADFEEMQLDGNTARQYLQLDQITQSSDKLLFELLKKHFQDEQPYLQNELSIREVADALKTNRSYLSNAIRKYANTNFSRFVNGYRTRLWLEKIKMDEDNQFDFGGLALDCGFKSKRSFFRVFKELYGDTPTRYLLRR